MSATVLFDCRVALENCFPMIPSGKAHMNAVPAEATDEATPRPSRRQGIGEVRPADV